MPLNNATKASLKKLISLKKCKLGQKQEQTFALRLRKALRKNAMQIERPVTAF
jgi:hypothetical protein